MEAKEEIKLLGGVRGDDAEGWGFRWRQVICCGDPLKGTTERGFSFLIYFFIFFIFFRSAEFQSWLQQRRLQTCGEMISCQVQKRLHGRFSLLKREILT